MQALWVHKRKETRTFSLVFVKPIFKRYFGNLNNVTLFKMIHFRFGPEKEDVLKQKDDFEAVKNIHFKD